MSTRFLRTLSIFLFLFSFSGLSQSASVHPCGTLINQEEEELFLAHIINSQAYARYVEHERWTERAGQTLAALRPNDFEFLDGYWTKRQDSRKVKGLRKTIRDVREKFPHQKVVYPDGTQVPAEDVLRLLGIDETVIRRVERAGNGILGDEERIELTNNVRFFFTPDLGTRHLNRMLTGVNHLEDHLLPHARATYSFLWEPDGEGPLWRRRLFLAALLQDTMADDRVAHSEAVFQNTPSLLASFPQGPHPLLMQEEMPVLEMAYPALIALFHAKEDVPTRLLNDWEQILFENSRWSEAAFTRSVLVTHPPSPLWLAARAVSARERERARVRDAIQALRAVHAHRPKGPQTAQRTGLVNSAGHRFLLNEAGRVYAEVPRAATQVKVYAPDHLDFMLYGQIAMGEPAIETSGGFVSLVFPVFRWEDSAMEVLQRTVAASHFIEKAHRKRFFGETLPMIKMECYHAASLAYAVADVVQEYPLADLADVKIKFRRAEQ